MDQARSRLAIADAAPGGVKLLTLNTHKGFTSFNRRFVLHELREAVHAAAADIVFLQEVLGSHDTHAAAHSNWPAEPQYQFLAGSIWGSVAYGRNAVYSEGHHGNAVLSKFPIVHFENHDISVGRSEERGLLHCVIKLPNVVAEVHAICTHLALHEAERRQQVRRLCDLVEQRVPPTAPLFIAGDFNDWRNQAHAVLRRCGGIAEAFEQAQGRVARSFPAQLPLLRLDRIYFRNAQLLRTAVLSSRPWSRLSDHAALTAELSL
ncbi:MAG: hypothetical protein JWR16_1846 [Nevskia sp.]|nr:hypothetical protein [Nevskia sp.]